MSQWISKEELEEWLKLERELDILELYRKHRETVADKIKKFNQ